MASVTIRGATKNYGSVQVLRGIDLDIGDGEFVVLVGESGCGKSTLLRMIAGLEEVTAGDIHIGGRLVNDVAPKDRDIAMVFQSYALYPHMSVERNMGFSLTLRRQAKAAIDALVSRTAGILGLERLLARLPKELSGGQRQRVAMGRAIVRQPQVFLFDEPLSNLDAKLRVQMRTEIKALHQQLKTTSVYVTHDQVEAMTMADRIVVMHGGVIQQVGGPLEVYDRPANRFVAGFIGSPAMNFFDGTVERRSGGPAIAISPDIALPLPPTAALGDGARIVCGVRPEHFRLDGAIGVPAEVEVVEPMGLSTVVFVRLAGERTCLFTMDRPRIAPGDAVRLSVAPEQVHLFSAEDGRRIG